MSHFDITDNQGNRHRVREGWYYPPNLPQGLAETLVDLQLLLSFNETAIEQIYDRFLRFEQQFPDPSHPRDRPQLESAFQFDPFLGAPVFLSDPGRKVYLALVEQRLIIEENPFGEDELAEQRSQLLHKIRMALRQIIAQERAEAAHHTRMLARESRVNRALIYTGAFFNGLWNAGVDLTKWVKEVNDVVNPTQRLLRSMYASHRALQRSRESGENILTAYADEHLKGEKRELVQALGFDPTAITAEQLDQAMEVATLVWDEPALRADITLFAKDYVKAQHAIELTNLSGSAAFEILFTIILAAVTAGVGLAASAASQARHFARFRKVGDLLMEFAEQVKKTKQRLRRSSAKGNDKPYRSLDDLPKDEVLDTKELGAEPRHRKENKERINDSNTPSKREVDLAKKPGKSPEQIKSRDKVARHYMKENGFSEPQISDALGSEDGTIVGGVDLTKPLEVVYYPPPEYMHQYVKSHGYPGNWFDPIGDQTPDMLGINGEGRTLKAFKMPSGSGLKSYSKPILDKWTTPGKEVQTNGGGLQLLINDNTKKSVNLLNGLG